MHTFCFRYRIGLAKQFLANLRHKFLEQRGAIKTYIVETIVAILLFGFMFLLTVFAAYWH